MRGEWNFVSLVNGKQCVVATGVAVKHKWCVNNLDMLTKVMYCDSMCYASVIIICMLLGWEMHVLSLIHI